MPKPNLKALGIAPKGKSISKKDFKFMKQIFSDYDKDNSGTVTYAEFLKALEGNEKCKALLKSTAGIFQEMDQDGDGEMTFAELMRAFYPSCTMEEIQKAIDRWTPKKKVVVVEVKQLTAEEKEEIQAMCKSWDKDNDGNVSLSELRDSCMNLGIEEETIKEWFKQYDADGNDQLSYKEVEELLREFWTA